MISVTETAAEKINQALVEQEMDGKSLKLGVFPGGCGGGYQYALGFGEKSENDTAFEANGLKVLINNEDVDKIKGTEIDYIVSEMGEGFRINNPNSAPEGKKGECSCGSDSSCC
ncbi:MAG: iron-sulfur cluster assembly accessory protein [Methanobacteriota archaeon]|jgi:iron-sulfur cluster assembly protein|nr:MAG: iron-sulfur cluster assembly accessory protein [Euryarchaeota archaeon]